MLEDNVELVEDFKKTICKMLQDVSGDVAEDKKDIEEPKTDFKLGKLDKTVASGNSTEGADRELRLESNLKQLESKVESRLLDMEARLAGVITEVRSDNVAVVDELNKKLSTSMNDWDGGRTRLEGSLSPIMGLVEGWSSRIQELELEVPKVGKKSVELRQDIQRTKEFVLGLIQLMRIFSTEQVEMRGTVDETVESVEEIKTSTARRSRPILFMNSHL